MICIKTASLPEKSPVLIINFMKCVVGTTHIGRTARSRREVRAIQVKAGRTFPAGTRFFPIRKHRDHIVRLEIPGAGGHTPACGRRMGEHGPMILRSDV